MLAFDMVQVFREGERYFPIRQLPVLRDGFGVESVSGRHATAPTEAGPDL